MEPTNQNAAGDEIVVGFFLIENFALFSYASALEPLRAANTLAGRPLYKWVHISVDGEPVRSSSGVPVSCDFKVGDIPPISRLFVCAGGNPAAFNDARTFHWLRQLSRRKLLIGAVSGGPYLLARAGLLDGYRFTIHWEHLPALAEEFPHLEPARGLYVLDRERCTSAGGLASLDMMHAMIERDFSSALANAVSKWFVQTNVRSADSPQRVSVSSRISTVSPRLQKVIEAIETHLEDPLSREALAEIAGLSTRQLDRLFQAELGMTASSYCYAARLERAKMLLLQSDMTVLDIAVSCGFSSASHFSRSYRRHFGRPPAFDRKYRGRALAAERRLAAGSVGAE